MSTIKFRNVNKVYPNGFHAVHDLNLNIKDGEFIVLVGPSGCGKSTTLRMLAGLEDISKGELIIDGQLANNIGPLQRGISMVFQSYALYPHLTVAENLAFGIKMQGLNAEVIDKRVERVAKMLGLTQYLDRYPRALSGGQRQRVAVGRAIIRQVKVFLMDEPLSNLDAKQRVTMRSEIINLHRKIGATTVYVTHDQTEAMTMADRIVVMKDGVVMQVGTPYELYFNPANEFVAGFIGEPPMNLKKVEIKNGQAMVSEGVGFPLTGALSKLSAYEGKTVTFGFRPEATKLGELENAVTFKAMPTLTEMLGDSVNVYATVGDKDVILKVSPYDDVKVGKEITFSIPNEQLYFFEPENGNVIK